MRYRYVVNNPCKVAIPCKVINPCGASKVVLYNLLLGKCFEREKRKRGHAPSRSSMTRSRQSNHAPLSCIVLLSCYLLCFKKCMVKRIHFMNYVLELKMNLHCVFTTFIISQSGWNNHDDTIWFYYLVRILNHHGYVLFSCYSRAGKWHLWLLPLSLWLDLGLTMTRGGLPKLNSSES